MTSCNCIREALPFRSSTQRHDWLVPIMGCLRLYLALKYKWPMSSQWALNELFELSSWLEQRVLAFIRRCLSKFALCILLKGCFLCCIWNLPVYLGEFGVPTEEELHGLVVDRLLKILSVLGWTSAESVLGDPIDSVFMQTLQQTKLWHLGPVSKALYHSVPSMKMTCVPFPAFPQSTGEWNTHHSILGAAKKRLATAESSTPNPCKQRTSPADRQTYYLRAVYLGNNSTKHDFDCSSPTSSRISPHPTQSLEGKLVSIIQGGKSRGSTSSTVRWNLGKMSRIQSRRHSEETKIARRESNPMPFGISRDHIIISFACELPGVPALELENDSKKKGGGECMQWMACCSRFKTLQLFRFPSKRNVQK